MNHLLQPSDVICPSCGDYLTKGRVKYSQSRFCTACDNTARKSAIRIISGKTTYTELQFTDAETASNFNKLTARSGQSPSAGMKHKSTR